MPKNAYDIAALNALTTAISDLATRQGEMTDAVADQVREQRATNLLVRSQILTDPTEKARLQAEAATLMDTPRRRTTSRRMTHRSQIQELHR